jgi:hypothetical protein
VTPHGMALVHQLFKSQFEGIDPVNLEGLANGSRDFDFVLGEWKISTM